MRWILFAILAYLSLLAQTTLGSLLVIHSQSIGAIMPDILAIVAVFFALALRNGVDVAIVCWILGLGLDLTSAGGAPDLSVVGPMPLAYAAAGYIVYKLREAFFRDKASSQMILAMVFCLLAHGLWILIQSLIAIRSVTFAMFGQMLLQALLLGVYSALLAPPIHAMLRRSERWFITAAGGRGGRER